MDGDEHRKWNLRTLLLLARAGILELKWENVVSAGTMGEAPVDAERSIPDQIIVQVLVADHLEVRTWRQLVGPCRDRILEPVDVMGKQLKRFLEGGECVAKILRDCYRSDDPDVSVVLACGGCPHCRTHGDPNYAGGLRCRHTPDAPWPPLSLRPGLTEFLAGRNCGLIFYRPEEDDVIPVFAWLLEQGIVHLTAGLDHLAGLESWQDRHPAALTFLDSFPPSSILASQPSAVIVGGRNDPQGATVWPEVIRREGVTVLLLPEDSRQGTGTLRSIRQWAYAARLALIHHLVRVAADDATVSDPDTVDETSMAAGIALSQWFGHEAKRVYALLAEDEGEQTIRELMELVERLGGKVTPRDLQRHSRRYKQAHVAENALQMLVNKNRGAWQPVPPSAKGGTPTRAFVLHRVDTTPAKPKENEGCVNVNGKKQTDEFPKLLEEARAVGGDDLAEAVAEAYQDNEFHRVDPDGQTLRYDRKKGTLELRRYKELPSHIGVADVRTRMESVYHYLDNCYAGILDWWDAGQQAMD